LRHTINFSYCNIYHGPPFMM